MAYIEPKTNWNEEYEPGTQDMNRIEGNIKHVKENIDEIEARSITAGDGLSGGGTLAGSRTIDVDSTVVRTSRTITAGAGLSGGGTLAENRTINVDGSVARIEGSTSATITNYAVGTIVAVLCQGRTYNLNSATTLYVDTGGSGLIRDYSGSGWAALSGTWRARGYSGFSGSSSSRYYLFQRVS